MSRFGAPTVRRRTDAIRLIDIPARGSDLVDGAYELELPAEPVDRPAAVRTTDMLGEEVLVVESQR